jgi:hypothetical protein
MPGSINVLIQFLSIRSIGNKSFTLISSQIEYQGVSFSPVYYIVIPSIIFWILFLLYITRIILKG